MIPDFPHNMYKDKIGQIDSFLLRPDVAKFLPCWLSQFRNAKLRFHGVRPNVYPNFLNDNKQNKNNMCHLAELKFKTCPCLPISYL